MRGNSLTIIRWRSEKMTSCEPSYSRFPVGCPKIATRIRACAKFPIQNPRQRARMRGFSSRFLDNQLEIACTRCSAYSEDLRWRIVWQTEALRYTIDCIDYVTGIGNVIQAPPHSLLRANTFSVEQQATNF